MTGVYWIVNTVNEYLDKSKFYAINEYSTIKLKVKMRVKLTSTTHAVASHAPTTVTSLIYVKKPPVYYLV